MRVIVDESPAGSGKTTGAVKRLVGITARYLWVTERVDSIKEMAAKVHIEAAQAGVSLAVIPITSANLSRGSSVRNEIEALPERYTGGHVVAICSHQGMMMSDFSTFGGWHIVIDEVPNVLDLQEVMSMKDVAFFRDHFTLTATETTGWSIVGLTDAGRELDGAQLASDDSHQHLRVFHRRVTEADQPLAKRSVICNLPDWSAMATLNMRWAWGSLFTLGQLERFASVTMLGNRFMASLAARLMAAHDPSIEWSVRNTPANRRFETREVHIAYFSDRRGSDYLFERPEGIENLAKIAAYLARMVDPVSFIWSAGEEPMKTLASIMPGRSLKPKQAGTNQFAAFDQAAMIYTTKPSPNVRALIRHLGVDQDAWIASNEHETILQFVTRTSVRNDASTAPVQFWVYEREQAEFLYEYFASLPYAVPTLNRVDLGLYDGEKRRGRKPAVLTPGEAKARADTKRHAARKRQADWRARQKGEVAA